MSTADATYGELINGAYGAAARAATAMWSKRFVTVSQAVEGVAAYRDLLDAVHTHIRYLVPQARAVSTEAVGNVGAEPSVGSLDSMLTRTSQLLGSRARRSTPGVELPTSALAWREASTKLRAAQDLLDTHRTPNREWRTPDAWLLDHPGAQAAAAESLAGLLRTIAGAGQALALRAREIEPRIDCADLLNPLPLRLVAAGLSRHPRGMDPAPALDALTAAHATSRPTAPAYPLGDARQAMSELRQRAWEHARGDQISIHTIGLYAALAVTVHQHAAFITTALRERYSAIAAQKPEAERIQQLQHNAQLSTIAAGAWRDVYRQCAGLHATSPAQSYVQIRVLAVQSDLEALSRQGASARPVAEMIPDAVAAARLLTAVYELQSPLEEMSAWHATAVNRLTSAANLYMPARALDRDDLADSPYLAAAHLARKLVPLPQNRADTLLALFVVADRTTWAAVRAQTSLDVFSRHARPALLAVRTLRRDAGWPSIGL